MDQITWTQLSADRGHRPALMTTKGTLAMNTAKSPCAASGCPGPTARCGEHRADGKNKERTPRPPTLYQHLRPAEAGPRQASASAPALRTGARWAPCKEATAPSPRSVAGKPKTSTQMALYPTDSHRPSLPSGHLEAASSAVGLCWSVNSGTDVARTWMWRQQKGGFREHSSGTHHMVHAAAAAFVFMLS